MTTTEERTTTWYVHPSPPIDFYSAMVPLSQWIKSAEIRFGDYARSEWHKPLGDAFREIRERLDWAASALAALEASTKIEPVRWDELRWERTVRHEPYVGCLPTESDPKLYLVVKQENNGTQGCCKVL